MHRSNHPDIYSKVCSVCIRKARMISRRTVLPMQCVFKRRRYVLGMYIVLMQASWTTYGLRMSAYSASGGLRVSRRMEYPRPSSWTLGRAGVLRPTAKVCVFHINGMERCVCMDIHHARGGIFVQTIHRLSRHVKIMWRHIPLYSLYSLFSYTICTVPNMLKRSAITCI